MHPVFPRTLMWLVVFSWALPAVAQRAQVPLTLEAGFLESVLRERVFTAPGGQLRVNDDGTGCQYLALSEPRVRTGADGITLRTTAEARAGRSIGGRCLLVLDWRGDLEFLQQPEVGDGGRSIVLHTVDWRAIRPDGSTDTVSTTIGSWLEQFLPPELTQTRIDFEEPLARLREFLGEGSRVALDSVAVDAVSVADAGARVTLGMEVPPAETTAAPAEPELSEAELARLEGQLDAVDAFFTNVIKSLDARERAEELLSVLVNLRQELVDVLSEPRGRARDPARALFLEAWEGLAPVVHGLSAEQDDASAALRYLTFISAGDALRTLDAVGPAAGIEISSNGLRRLARLIMPDGVDDPLRHDEAVDVELRRVLGFGDPLPPPQATNDTTWVDGLLDLLIPRAVAAQALDPALVKKLNNSVPSNRDIGNYLPMVRDVLHHVVSAQLSAGELDSSYHDLYRWLVFATAWQESCWRQFTAKNDKRVPVESGSGDLGVMQINATVWRGLYDLHGLRWDIVYNARAGADILEHYLITYALRHGEHTATGSVDNLARSTYAAYNGGPRQYDRYRQADASDQGKKVDALFYDKYREVKSGAELAVTACYSGG